MRSSADEFGKSGEQKDITAMEESYEQRQNYFKT